MQYSPIKTLRLRNFMGIEDTTISFDSLSRVVLEGYNSTGKSSIGMGLDVLATNSFTSEQKHYIKDTPYQADEFIIDCTLQSGHKITYVKMKKGYYYVVECNGQTILDTRLSNGSHTVIEDSKVPLIVHQLLGFVKEKETKQKLNIRRVSDGKLFVGVPGSVNFKVVYRQLDLPEVVDSIKDINNDKLKVDKNITTCQTKKDYLMEQYSSMVVYDQDSLEQLQSDVQIIVDKVSKLKQIDDIARAENELENKLQPYIELLSSHRFNLLSKLFSTGGHMHTLKSKLEKAPSLSTIDSVKYLNMNKLIVLAKSMKLLEDKLSSSVKMVSVETDKVKRLEKICVLNNKINKLTKEQSVKIDSLDSANYLMLLNILTASENIKRGIQQIDKIEEIPFGTSELNELTVRNQKLSAIKVAYNMYKGTKKQETDLSVEADTLRNELADLENEIKASGMTICPKCHNVFNADEKEVLV